ncbi:flagellar hook assembly protein FlgD [Vibrio crassostreae]|uniref:flagellar hook assembly protein FlgD n=1 Tax=Vibrio crassostreae TaxID=246167 RepID=UPI001B30B3D9|nr:flagellar hook assembly protein FlgD [Vibrio crassostreae]
MEISSTNTTTSTASTSDGSSNTSSDLSEGFMTMFVASLMNQDPTDPMDTTEMTNQLAQLSMLDQQEQMNANLQNLTSAVINVGSMVSMGLVGETVTVAVGNFEWDSTVGGSIGGELLVDEAKLEYEYKIDVLDENGEVVTTIDTTIEEGKLVYEWDGTDADGNKVPSGSYSFEPYYLDYEGNKIEDSSAVPTVTAPIKTMNYWPYASTELDNGMLIYDAAILAVEKTNPDNSEI